MALPATDSFTGTNGTQIEVYSANWTLNAGAIDIQSNAIAPDNPTDESGAHWNADSFSNDQYAELTLAALASGYQIGPAVRAHVSAATYYIYYTDGGATQIAKMVGGVWTQLGSDLANPANGSVLKLEVSGTTLTAYDDDVSQGSRTDSSIASGYAGVAAYGDNTTTRGDNFEGGNLGVTPVSIAVDALALAGAAQAADVQPGAVSVAADVLSLAGAAQAASVQSSISIPADTLGLIGAAQAADVQPGAVSIAVDALVLAGAAQAPDVQPGAISVAVDALTLAGAAQAMDVQGVVSIAVDALTLTGAAQATDIQPGAVSVAVDAIGLACVARVAGVQIGAVTVVVNALTMTGAAQATDVQPGAVSVAVDALDFAGAAQVLDVQPGAVSVSADALAMNATPLAMTAFTAGGVVLAMAVLGLTLSARGIGALSVPEVRIALIDNLTPIKSAADLTAMKMVDDLTARKSIVF